LLDELVPDHLPEIPIDPFDSAGRHLLYLHNDGDYVLYSVGEDHEDNGGRSPVRNEWGEIAINGDLRLGDFFAPRNVATQTSSTENDAQQ
jgi:hypothetical protein